MNKVPNLNRGPNARSQKYENLSGSISYSCFALTSEINAAKTARVFIDSEASTSYNERKESEMGLNTRPTFSRGKSYGGLQRQEPD